MFDTVEHMEGPADWQLGDDELLRALADDEARSRRLYARQLARIGELVERNLALAKGYRSSTRLLQDLLRISRADADRRLAQAAVIAPVQPITGPPLPVPMPMVAEAMRAGVIGSEHLEPIRRTLADLPPIVSDDDRALAEKVMVEAAHTVGPAALAKLGRGIVARLDHDGSPPTDTERRHQPNELRWTTRANGTLDLRGRLAPEGAALFTSVLSPLTRPRPATPAPEHEGSVHQVIQDPRTQAERRGDALVDALRLAAACGELPADGGDRPTVVVTMTLDALSATVPDASESDATGEAGVLDTRVPPRDAAILDGAGVIEAGRARRIACDSAVVPVVLGASSEPLDIGRRTRVVPTAIRRALHLRDQGCAFPSCTIPARWCDAHHLRHWADGGATSIDNLVLLCGTHHELLHGSDWCVGMQGGRPEFTPPEYLGPTRSPRRNPAHAGVP